MANTFYVGTYTAKSKGIYQCEFDPTTGAMTIVDAVGGVENPSFVALHPSRKFLYAACETDGPNGGGVAAFAIDGRTGKLSPLNQQSSKGGGPCYVACDHRGHNLVVANYGTGSVACLPILPDGKLAPAASVHQDTGSSVNKSRQSEPHAHSINFDPQDRFAVACDLGTDKLYVYRLNQKTGVLTPNDPPACDATPGAGPRHFTFHPNQRFAYGINEINSTITAYRWDKSNGRLEPIESVSTLPSGFAGDNTTAEVVVHPNGKFVLGSNRGLDSIAVFAMDAGNGKLKLLGNTPTGGKTPRNFVIAPGGEFVIAANQNSDNLVAFRFDQTSGKLTPTGQTLSIPAAVCIRFV